jgi:hypothetical protein
MGRRPRYLALAALALAVAVPGTAQAAEGVSRARALGPPPSASHTVVIVLEDREFGEVVDGPAPTSLDRYARIGALATNFYAITHPSLPNYLAMVGGSTFGVTDSCTECTAPGPNLATQLSEAGVSWRAYMQDMPSPCFSGAQFDGYVKRHNPFMYFPSLVERPDLCGRVVPEIQLHSQLARHQLPEFAWITPSLCNNSHDCPFSASDTYLDGLVPTLLDELGPHGLLILTFDEGISEFGCCGYALGGRIATILIGPDVRENVRIQRSYTTYSLLATLEDRFRVDRLGAAASASPMTAAFRTGRVTP